MTEIVNLEPKDYSRIRMILRENHLPDEDILQVDWLVFAGMRLGEEVIAFGGLERCGSSVLLRSVVVLAEHRGKKLARRIVGHLHNSARDHGYTETYLLTLDATAYFSQAFAYECIDRSNVPDDIAKSNQFSNLCPDSADLMRLTL